MEKYAQYFNEVDLLSKEMLALLESWVAINSSSFHQEGLKKMATALIQAFSSLQAEISVVPLENSFGDLLSIKKRRNAPIQVLFGGHFDTVFLKDSLFQKASWVDKVRLRGPGVADMKGGIAVLLTLLTVFEKSPYREQIGWEVFLNPDEEIGSRNSKNWIEKKAAHYQVGLLFEPSFPDGYLVSARKGSINYTLQAKGKKAHVGRNFFDGKNAIYALARVITHIESHFNNDPNVIVNVGVIKGGETLNTVPEYADCRINVRADTEKELQQVHDVLQALIEKESGKIEMLLSTDTFRPPKPFDFKTEKLFQELQQCAKDLNGQLFCRPSGGVCDGNILAKAGLPTLDTLGVIGGNLHTEDEYMEVASLASRTKMVLLYLFRLAEGEYLV